MKLCPNLLKIGNKLGADDNTNALLKEFLQKNLDMIQNREALVASSLSNAENFGKAPPIALGLPAMPTIEQKLYANTMNTMLSKKDKMIAAAKILNESKQQKEYNKLLAIITGGGAAAVSPAIIDFLTLGLLKHSPYNIGGTAGKGGDIVDDERTTTKILKDIAKGFGTAFIAVNAAKILSQKSAFEDLRTPVEDSNVNIWNILNR